MEAKEELQKGEDPFDDIQDQIELLKVLITEFLTSETEAIQNLSSGVLNRD